MSVPVKEQIMECCFSLFSFKRKWKYEAVCWNTVIFHTLISFDMATTTAWKGSGWVLTPALVAASEAVGFFAVAEPVDEGAQRSHVPHPACHHHLLLDDVGLRKVRPSLWERDANESLSGRNTANRKMGTCCPSLSQTAVPLLQSFHNGFHQWHHRWIQRGPHLDVDEQLPQVPWRHHQSGVQLSDVAFVQSNVMISCEALK